MISKLLKVFRSIIMSITILVVYSPTLNQRTVKLPVDHSVNSNQMIPVTEDSVLTFGLLGSYFTPGPDRTTWPISNPNSTIPLNLDIKISEKFIY